MKKSIALLCLSALTLGSLVSCGASNNSSSSEAHDSNSSSSTDATEGWTRGQKNLIRTYCGEVLPYPTNYTVGNISMEQYYNESTGISFLEITDEATSFTVKEYYTLLENDGWKAVTSYSGKKVQSDTTGVEFVELTKSSDNKAGGFDIIYFYSPEYTAEDGTVVPSSNVIRCYNHLTGTNSGDSAWGDADSSTIQAVLTTALPFIDLSYSYSVYKSSLNSLSISDYYTEDKTAEYASLLLKGGFSLDEDEAKKYDMWVLSKTLSDGAKLEAYLSYFMGNSFSFYYTPKETTYSSWPSEVINEIATKTGVTIPEFKIKEGGEYITYKKNNTYYIYTYSILDSTEYNYTTYAEDTLFNPSLRWEETISFTAANLTDDEGEATGFLITATVATPSSTFVSSWPEAKIADTVTNLLSIEGISLPTLEASDIPSTGKQIKYSIAGQDTYKERYDYYLEDITAYPSYYGLGDNPTEEQIKAEASRLARLAMGITVSILDVGEKSYKAYSEKLYNLGWYKFSDVYSRVCYEDPEGKIVVTLDTYENPSHDYEGVTEITFSPGSGNKHEEEFYFLDEEVTIQPGSGKLLGLVQSMLPYEVTFASSDATGKISVDETGYVSVDEDTIEGTTATITASISVPGESSPRTVSCAIVAQTPLTYTAEEAINAVNKFLTDKGYSPKTTQEDENYYSITNFGSSVSLEELKTMVDTTLIPTGFEILDSRYTWETAEFKNKKAKLNIYFYQNETYDFTYLKYYIYTSGGNTYLVVNAY